MCPDDDQYGEGQQRREETTRLVALEHSAEVDEQAFEPVFEIAHGKGVLFDAAKVHFFNGYLSPHSRNVNPHNKKDEKNFFFVCKIFC